MAKLLISEQLFNEVKNVIDIMQLDLLKEDVTCIKKHKDDITKIANVLSYIVQKRELNRKIDEAVASYNESLVNQLLSVKDQAIKNLTENERALI